MMCLLCIKYFQKKLTSQFKYKTNTKDIIYIYIYIYKTFSKQLLNNANTQKKNHLLPRREFFFQNY